MMITDRRSFVGGLLIAGMLPGCARAGPVPVGSGPWRAFAGRFLAADGRIVDSGNGGISHSEGQGYGMLLAEAAGDRDSFDRVWGWTSRTLKRPDMSLYSWRFDPAAPNGVSDTNNATDGDIGIAWALLRAARRWGASDYAAQSAAIRKAIRGNLVRQVGPRTVLLPGLQGFERSGSITLNPSYYVWPALDAFAAADGAAAWSGVIRGGERLILDARFGAAQLITDWVDVTNDGRVIPAVGRPARFGFDAIRVPLYLAWGRRRAALAPYRSFWGGYLARSAPVPAWIDVTSGEQAPYALSDGGMAVVDIVNGRKPRRVGSGDYYASALGAMANLLG